MSIHLCRDRTTSMMLPPAVLKVVFASFWVNSELQDWVPAGQEWGLQGRFPQNWTDRWSERGGPFGSCPQEWHQLLSIFFPRLRKGIGHFSGLRLQLFEGVCYFLMRWMKVLNSGNIGGLFVGGREGACLCHLESSLNMHDLAGKAEVAPWFV